LYALHFILTAAIFSIQVNLEFQSKGGPDDR
jgi:hypothetical protein